MADYVKHFDKLPKVANRKRRDASRESFETFCYSYFPEAFCLPWGTYHKRMAELAEICVLEGGLFVFAMPRGSGKSTICISLVLWAILHGHKRYAILIGSSEAGARRRLSAVKQLLRHSDRLLEDFPEACLPIRHIDGQAVRCRGQTYQGAHTDIKWEANHLVLPTMPESASSGSVIDVFGMTGDLRGYQHITQTGEIIRPDLAIPDDPQTRESSKSAVQTHDRERTISGDIAYAAGPGQPISVIMPCTIIHNGDLADQLLDREKHPEWRGERAKMVETFPTDTALWDRYGEQLRADLITIGRPTNANKFYRDNREAMDAGAVVSWPARKARGEISAIQHAMNLKIRDPESFWAECQNEPVGEEKDLMQLDAGEICRKTNGYPRGIAPADVSHVTAFIDVQGVILYWTLFGWSDDFTGYLLDHGAHPKQRRNYYALRDVSRTLALQYGTKDQESSIHAGITDLLDELASREIPTVDGSQLYVERIGVDANWGGTSATVKNAIRASPHAAIAVPTHGRGITARNKPISEYNSPKSRIGAEWMFTKPPKQKIRSLIYDVNYWKQRFTSALSQDVAARGGITIFQLEEYQHRMLGEHWAAERSRLVESGGRSVFEWTAKKNQDNHLFDCAVGAMVLANTLGAENIKVAKRGRAKRPRMTVKL